MPRALVVCATSAVAAGALGLLALGTVSSFVALPTASRDNRSDFHSVQVGQGAPGEHLRKLQAQRGGEAGVGAWGVPDMLYGTAWKEERTADLVAEAIAQGFRGIDTACQPKHYREDLVGEGIRRALAADPSLSRENLFLQTKYTPLPGQDPNRVPYDPDAPIAEQVHQSVRRSLENLGVDYIDSLVLHSPLNTLEDTLTAWTTLEGYVDRGVIRRLGVSNCYDLRFFTQLFDAVRVKPSVLQNRWVEKFNWSDDLRGFCLKRAITFQSFWTLTGNRHAVHSRLVGEVARRHGLTSEQMFFRFAQLQGIAPLSGTTNPNHMREDMSVSRTPSGTRWLVPEAWRGNPRAGWEELGTLVSGAIATVELSDEELLAINGVMRRHGEQSELRTK